VRQRVANRRLKLWKRKYRNVIYLTSHLGSFKQVNNLWKNNFSLWHFWYLEKLTFWKEPNLFSIFLPYDELSSVNGYLL
jgi:hypothetical protein